MQRSIVLFPEPEGPMILLDLYDPNGAGTLAKLREEQVKHGGIV